MSTIVNHAQAKGDNTNAANDTAKIKVNDGKNPKLNLIKKVNGQDEITANPGDSITFTITVKNEGPGVAENVVMTDDAPGGITFSGTASTDKGTVTTNTSSKVVVTIGDLAEGETATITIPATVN